jgi:hypothetical protein
MFAFRRVFLGKHDARTRIADGGVNKNVRAARGRATETFDFTEVTSSLDRGLASTIRREEDSGAFVVGAETVSEVQRV